MTIAVTCRVAIKHNSIEGLCILLHYRADYIPTNLLNRFDNEFYYVIPELPM